ncbi:MAG: hypothetical protein JO247_18755 [Chloroflexi bacterium]|nr:hypothetical protein [Chloroflexota bacterium]
MRRLLPLIVLAITFVVYAAFTPWVETRLDPLTGDEPFYVMTAHNLLAGRGLDETQSWLDSDFQIFYPQLPVSPDWQGWPAFPIPLPPHNSIGTVPAGLYTKHGLGVSLLILPFWALGQRTAVVLFLNAVGALVAVNVFLLSRDASEKLWIAVAVWLAFTFTNPLMSYSYLIFPEILAALFTVYAFRRIRAEENNGWQSAAIGGCIAFLPWLHARFVLISAALFMYWFWRHFWQAASLSRISILPLLPVSLSAAVMLDFYFYLYRSFLPNAQDHGGTSGFTGTLYAAAGLFLDQQWGLLVYAPVYLVALAAGLVFLWRRPKEAGWWLAILVPYFVLVANYRVWWGEWCPPARYLVATLPLLALPLASMLGQARWPWVVGALSLPLALASWAAMAGFLADPQLMYNQPTGQSQLLFWLADRTGVDLTGAIPSFVAPFAGIDLDVGWLIAAGLAMLAIAVWFGWRRIDEPDQAFVLVRASA